MVMELFRTLNQKWKEMNRLLVRRGNKIEDMVKEIQNNNQRPAGVQQLRAQQPRLTVKEDTPGDKKTRESRKGFAPDGRLGDILSDRVHDDPVRLISFVR